MITVTMDEDVISSKTIAIEDHNSDGWFGDITE
jgi:hypothetical protein